MLPPNILALEANPERGQRLKRFVEARVGAEVVVAHSAEAAIRRMAFLEPDVILTSALLPPQDEARLLSHLRRLDTGPVTPVLTIPPFNELEIVATARLTRFFPLMRRAGSVRPAYDLAAVTEQIRDVLEQSRSARLKWLHSDSGRGSTRRSDDRSSNAAARVTILQPVRVQVPRAYRWAPADLPWLCSVQTPMGLEAQVLNISRSGMLIKSRTKLAPDSLANLSLCGEGTSLVVPGRILRSEVAFVDARGVTFHMATVFDGRLELLPDPDDSPLESSATVTPIRQATPEALAELLVRVTKEIGRSQDASVVRTMFEQGLQRLLAAPEIRIRRVPIPPPIGHESVYFTIPDERGSGTVLQVTFEQDYEVSADELKVLRAAAAAASVVLLYEDTRPPIAQAISA